ncbi:MAG: hypothetical protein IID42_01695 [Planctomycetes bacterium]|nr:hypothetical protein [Planctomycetota bacterium]
MQRPPKYGVLCAAALLPLVVAFPRAAQAQGAPPTVGRSPGQVYPDFYLPKLDGGFGRLSDFRGKKVLLIHFASW